MKKILFVDDKPAIGKVLSVYLGKPKIRNYHPIHD